MGSRMEGERRRVVGRECTVKLEPTNVVSNLSEVVIHFIKLTNLPLMLDEFSKPARATINTRYSTDKTKIYVYKFLVHGENLSIRTLSIEINLHPSNLKYLKNIQSLKLAEN